MANFNLKKKAPKNYSYPLSAKALKKFALENEEIKNILYAGISPHDQIKKSTMVWFGEIIARRDKYNWFYDLNIYASRNTLLETVLSNKEINLLKEISKWLEWNSKHLASPLNFNRLYLSAKNEDGAVKSTTKEHSSTGFNII